MPSKSKSQRRLMGYAYAIKKAGKKSDKYKDAPQSVKDVADSMTKKELKKMAKTKEKKLPEKVKESNIVTSFENFKLNENLNHNDQPSIEEIETHGILLSDYDIEGYEEEGDIGFCEIYKLNDKKYFIANWYESALKNKNKEIIKVE